MEKLVEIYVRLMVAMTAARKGQGLVEYTLILVLISVVSILVMTALGARIGVVFQSVITALTP